MLAPRTRVRIDARFPSGLIVSGTIALAEGATWSTAVDQIDDDDRLKPLEDAVLVWNRQVVRRGVAALVRLKAALYLREDADGRFVEDQVIGGAAEDGADTTGQ